MVYQTVVKAQNTSDFVARFPGDVKVKMEALIAKKMEAKRAQLEARKEEAKANADNEALDAIDRQLAALEGANYGSVDNYSPLSVFDVSASNALLEQMKEGDTVDVTFEINGVNQESDLIALHFRGDIQDCDATMEGINQDFQNTVVEFDVEVLDVVAEDGKATMTLSSFSPVMILTRVENQVEVQPSQQPEEVPEEEKSNATPWVILGSVVVVLGVVIAVTKKSSGKE